MVEIADPDPLINWHPKGLVIFLNRTRKVYWIEKKSIAAASVLDL